MVDRITPFCAGKTCESKSTMCRRAGKMPLTFSTSAEDLPRRRFDSSVFAMCRIAVLGMASDIFLLCLLREVHSSVATTSRLIPSEFMPVYILRRATKNNKNVSSLLNPVNMQCRTRRDLPVMGNANADQARLQFILCDDFFTQLSVCVLLR
jgi:hypothetical protein